MATLPAGAPPRSAEQSERRFYFVMALAMSLIIVAGFTLNLAMGRSTFAAPAAYHAHALVFMGWLALSLVQGWTIVTGRRELHIRLGKLGYLWVPAMVAMGITIMILVARRTGGPFFFAQNEFLVSNIALLLCFGALAMWSLATRRHMGWHRRLMLVGFSILTGPGVGRLLPMPLLIPNAWTISFLTTLIFPAILMAADMKRLGRVHPALLWGTGAYIATFVISMMLAYTPVGYTLTEWVLAGTPGAERPMTAFIPPGFTM